jgi:hypothetical protein
MGLWITPIYGKLPRMAANQHTTRAVRLPELSPAEERARQVLTITMDILGFDAGDLAKIVGCSRSNIEGKLNKRSRIRIGAQDVEYAAALGVPVELFTMDPLDAGAWVLANRSEQVSSRFGWLGRTPALATAS